MSSQNIPVINIAALDQCHTLRALDSACRTTGIFHAIGHGISVSVQQQTVNAMREFFSLSAEQKQAIARTDSNHWGYYDRELTKNQIDLKEIFDYGRSLNGSLKPQWPEALPSFQLNLEQYFSACEQLAFKLLGALATNLGVTSRRLEQDFLPDNSSFLRLNYYPLQPSLNNTALGIHPHTDAGALTILLQQEPAALEIQTQNGWQLVEPVEDVLTINIGDIVQVWSNDRYRAPLHRVLASRQKQRYSAAYFFNPTFDATYQPLSSTIDGQHRAKYRPINWNHFREQRAKGDYRDDGQEIQISDFKVST
jgi:isopenicillin N synthase-like dioxygenase